MKSLVASPQVFARSGVLSSSVPLRLQLFRLIGKQTWIPRGQDWMLRKIWDPDSGQSYPFEVDFFGMRYPGDLSQLIDWRVFAYGCHASAELTLLKELATDLRGKKKRLCFYDIGANLGHHTLFMAGCADQVIAFEPFAPLQERICEKLRLNALTNVLLIPCALGEEDSTQRYWPGGGANSGSGTFLPEEIGTYTEPVEIRVRNGDHLCSEMGLPPVDLIKMDVEGFEPLVLHGLADTIRRDRPPILMEICDRARAGFGSEEDFRSLFWEDAVFAEVTGRSGCSYHLKPLHYATAGELLAVPPEMGDFVRSRLAA
ncbi:FkbM family methyltransferase [Paracidobacterium acidisoli]|nr:FkbM family methyltransferase [Paracidobacterium acidisoli]MBT9331801.1 FkbM family methyltransferase [Paracidobacterium acidisoli]